MKIKDIVAKITNHKTVIAKERESLRELYDEIGGLLESFDTGIEGLEEAILSITNAVNSISEIV